MTIEALHQLFLTSNGLSTDTRSVQSGDLFFALKGENFNGNTFAHQALKKGASYAVIDELQDSNCDQFILVKNVLATLQELANFHRNHLNIPIIALTGSNGKTTTKELIHSVLFQNYNTRATKGNLNNHIGVPLTLLQMSQATELGIVEMGANHIGEIAELCRIAQPNYGYITNFGKAHLEGFGGEEGVIKGKSELYDSIKKNDGIVIVNSDDPKQIAQLGGYENCIGFSEGSDSEYQIELVSKEPFLKVKFMGHLIETQLIGAYNFSNIAAAITLGQCFEVDPITIKKGIESYRPENNRSQIIKQNNNTIILDAYNANPSSMVEALKTFNGMHGDNKVVVLGDMFELGDYSDLEHKSVIELTLSFNFSKAIFVGSHFFNHAPNYPNEHFFKTTNEVKNNLQQEKIADSFVLIKGSRGMALEDVIQYL